MNEHIFDESGETIALSISGMTCGSCAKTVARILSQVPGVTDAKVDLGSGSAMVSGKASADALIAAVQSAGYAVYLAGSDSTSRPSDPAPRARHGCC